MDEWGREAPWRDVMVRKVSCSLGDLRLLEWVLRC
jgi:hypothetical protein